ncbi:hypothetical protein J6590_070173 [Homalodisca vitripennis]|nr:hypothetical protein J6590_070173 [Homalodisca vitripennis]
MSLLALSKSVGGEHTPINVLNVSQCGLSSQYNTESDIETGHHHPLLALSAMTASRCCVILGPDTDASRTTPCLSTLNVSQCGLSSQYNTESNIETGHHHPLLALSAMAASRCCVVLRPDRDASRTTPCLSTLNVSQCGLSSQCNTESDIETGYHHPLLALSAMTTSRCCVILGPDTTASRRTPCLFTLNVSQCGLSSQYNTESDIETGYHHPLLALSAMTTSRCCVILGPDTTASRRTPCLFTLNVSQDESPPPIVALSDMTAFRCYVILGPDTDASRTTPCLSKLNVSLVGFWLFGGFVGLLLVLCLGPDTTASRRTPCLFTWNVSQCGLSSQYNTETDIETVHHHPLLALSAMTASRCCVILGPDRDASRTTPCLSKLNVSQCGLSSQYNTESDIGTGHHYPLLALSAMTASRCCVILGPDTDASRTTPCLSKLNVSQCGLSSQYNTESDIETGHHYPLLALSAMTAFRCCVILGPDTDASRTTPCLSTLNLLQYGLSSQYNTESDIETGHHHPFFLEKRLF